MRTRLVTAASVTLLLLAGSLTVARSGEPPLALSLVNAARHAPTFRIGFDKELLDPDPADVAAHTVHLGGYGLFPTRATNGPMVLPDGTPEHLFVRAMAIVNHRGKALLLADLENQGTFAAYKQCACGIWDVRRQVAADRHLPVESIVVNSDHSHSGPDLIGLWGGVPVHYLQYVHDQTVKALEAALDNAVPANLLAGSSNPVMPTPGEGGYVAGSATPGESLVHSQFGQDTVTGHDESLVDTELRVLQAVTPDGRLLGTLINYAAHATTTGSGNLLYSADWPGWVARKTEQALGEPVAVTMVADVGRSQPPRPNTGSPCGQGYAGGCDADKLDTYSRIMLPFVVDAVTHAAAVTNDGIDNREVFTREPATNPALLAVSYSGELPANGYGAYRSTTTPWVTGNVIGTFASAHRVGDLLLTAAPGEAYPDIRFGLERSVTGFSKVFTFGLANDQLGYLVAPASEYPWITVSVPGNDNAFFNVSAAYGDHLLCSQTAAATALGFAPTGDPLPYGSDANPPACPAYAASDLVPMGPAPQQPWPFGDGVQGSPSS
ncbi:MAG: hypothetical protein E6G17_05335 [Actinobacteria bacterium]|nr:MAG: hypothetical protein E6G17_05335 [Actinomycetota bacterium]